MTVTIKSEEGTLVRVPFSVFADKVKTCIKDSIIELKGEEAAKKYMSGKYTLLDIGICEGITILIDKKLSEIKDGLVILSTDTVSKFYSDIKRDLKNEIL